MMLLTLIILAAVPDSWIVGFGIFQVLFGAVMTIAIWKLTSAQRRYDGLEERLHQVTTRLVDERFRSMTHEINNHVQGLISTVDQVKQRLRDGDAELDGLGKRDQQIELSIAAKLDAIKDYLREKTASREDVVKSDKLTGERFDRLERRVATLSETVAVLSSRKAGT